MTNHMHVIIEPDKQEGLQILMQSLGRRYVQYINYTYRRTGTLWEGRYKSSVIDKDNYLFACGRYIELNPVRAKMVKHPKEYPWSSYRHRAEGILNKLIDFDPAYAGLGKTDRERQLNYRKLFLEEIPGSEIKLIRFCTQKGGVIGSKSFVAKMAKKTGRGLIVRPKGRPRKSL